LQIRKEINDKKGQAEVLLFLAGLPLSNTGSETEPLELLKEALVLGNETKALDLLAKIHFGFYGIYQNRYQFEKALASFETYNEIEKKIHKEALAEKVVNLETTHRAEQARKEAEIYRLRNVELAGLYEEIKKQKEETEIQKQKAVASLWKLKAAQAQLIQSEKMASLGELTAGIAHEIQNPLNFINNFSEVSIEILDEMKNELAEGNTEEALRIAGDLKSNHEKIIHQGRRADAIVKRMLEHSRTSRGEKQPTDLNGLVAEYLHLAYHGTGAKDKSFNALLETHFDPTIGKLNVVPQDLGRVLLNIFNNAFYAVAKKKEVADSNYEPVISARTKKKEDKVEITISDNGTGMSQEVQAKIFQPFFTTKPTGEGIGIGLSLSYDIIKVHGGEIKASAIENEGTVFTIVLPLGITERIDQ
jgi:C4-dicarboxylate-specific signal transduction histidine kinase